MSDLQEEINFMDCFKGLIHDIRTSIGVIEQCLEPSIVADSNIDHLKMARKQATQALALLSQLENSLERGTDTINVSPVTGKDVHNLLVEFESQYTKKVKVRFECLDDDTVMLDANLLRRVIGNCIQNAFVAGKSEWVLLTCEHDNDVMQIHVKDGGCGMTKQQLDRIGLGFSTTGGGSGTKILIDLLARGGGTIRWASIPDVGTCVTIIFKLEKV